MTWTWTSESPARWDSHKARILGGAEPGAFPPPVITHGEGDIVGGEWFRAEEEGRVVAYAYLDIVWGDAEVLLAVDPTHRSTGTGALLVAHLVYEARRRGLRSIYNRVPLTHPQGDRVAAWLVRNGFTREADGTLRRRV